MNTGDPRKIAPAAARTAELVWTIAALKAFWNAEPGSADEAEAYEALTERMEALLRSLS